VEALVRWHHPERGLLPPNDFIPQAEQNGLIGPLTRWVLHAALTQAGAWRADGLELSVAVNLSMRNLLDADLPEVIAALLAASKVPPAMLRVEVTESAAMSDPRRTIEALSRLNELGVCSGIDDFGTGYSSLLYLKRLPVREIKIDRSFVHDMVTDSNSLAIVRATLDLGHALGLDVVAEGVEDEGTWRLLGELGCDIGQGYYFSRPLPAAELANWLRSAPSPHPRVPPAGTPPRPSRPHESARLTSG
jgi:diguanylate cyclase